MLHSSGPPHSNLDHLILISILNLFIIYKCTILALFTHHNCLTSNGMHSVQLESRAASGEVKGYGSSTKSMHLCI